jgi:hypothetical protein
MNVNRSSHRRRTVNRYVADALTLAIIGVTIGALSAVHVVITGHSGPLDGWGAAGAATLIVVGVIGAVLAALTMPRHH